MAVKKPIGWRGEVAQRVTALQKNAGKSLDQALKMLPPAQQRTVKEITSNVSKARATFRKRAEGLVKDVNKRAEGALKDVSKRTELISNRLQKRVEGVVGPFTKQAQGVLNDVSKRAEKVSAQVEKRVEGIVTPISKRLDLPTRAEVEKLRKRLDTIEKKIAAKPKSGSTSRSGPVAVA